MNFQLDRQLTIPIGTQLRGQIEYGIICGELEPGSQLPKVRDLAESLGVSPVTVSNVYKELGVKKLLVSKPGQGTFVAAEIGSLKDSETNLYSVNRMIDNLLNLAQKQGIASYQLIQMIQLRQKKDEGVGISLLFVGLFSEATSFYAAQIQRELSPHDHVQAITLKELASNNLSLDLKRFDLALCSRHCLKEAQNSLPITLAVSPIGFLPSEETRSLLAQFEPMTRIGVVATYPEFLGVLKNSVIKFAPHVDVVSTAVLDDIDVDMLIGSCDVIIYASGSEIILSKLPSYIPAIEFRHIPDPRDFKQTIQPQLDQLRRKIYALNP